jgi:integrase/recombinase XerD
MKDLDHEVDEYLALRRGLGYRLERLEETLRELVGFLKRRQAERVTTRLALEFATLRPALAAKTKSQRLSAVRGFARYQIGEDPKAEVPPIGLLPRGREHVKPYLYTDEEIRRLLAAALARDSLTIIQPWTYHCLLGLLAVTGMRVREVLNLECHDVDLAEGVLTVRKTKFGKTRLIPLHPSTIAVLRRYAGRRDRYLVLCRYAPAVHFFISSCGRRVHKAALDRVFWELSRKIGLREVEASFGPRMHDLRHRFAVETLVRWYQAGENIDQRIYVLSTYLGHVDAASTYWYLRCTPRLMAAAAQRLEKRWEEIT